MYNILYFNNNIIYTNSLLIFTYTYICMNINNSRIYYVTVYINSALPCRRDGTIFQ